MQRLKAVLIATAAVGTVLVGEELGLPSLTSNSVNQELVARASGVTTIWQSQFKQDIAAVRDAADSSSPWVRQTLNIAAINAIRDNGINAYAAGDIETETFDSVFAVYSESLSKAYSQVEYNQDKQGLMSLYQHFRSRFSERDQATLSRDLAAVDSNEDWDDQATDLAAFADDLSGAFENYARDISQLEDDTKPVATVPSRPQPAKHPRLASGRVYHKNSRQVRFINGRVGAQVTLKNRHHQTVKRVTIKRGTFTINLTKKQAKALNRGGKYFTYTVKQKHHQTYTLKYTIH